MKHRTLTLRRSITALFLLLALCGKALAAMPERLVPCGHTAGIKLYTGGLLITALDEQAPAQRAGLRAGDTILKIDGTRVCSGVILPDDAFDPWLTMQADTDPFWIAADGSTLVLPLPGTQSLVVAPAESEQAAQELLQSLQEALPDETKNAISPYLK